MKYKVRLGKGHHSYRWAHKHCECTSMHSSTLIRIISFIRWGGGGRFPPKHPASPHKRIGKERKKGEREAGGEVSMLYIHV